HRRPGRARARRSRPALCRHLCNQIRKEIRRLVPSMTGGEMLVCFAAFMSFTKPHPKPEPRKKRPRKRIARKSKFRVFENPFKTYRTEPTENIRSKAEKCRAEQLAHNWPAEAALADMLTKIGVKFERQAIIFRTGSYICVDILVRDRSVAF